jgi:hypothetical protein
MVIAANDYIAVDRRDTTGNVGTYGAIQAYGTTANTSNVTQLTSRTTGVTINAPVGTITLFSVLNSATDSTFTVTNSFVDAGDVVLVTQKTGTDPRRIAVTATAAGSFAVTSASISGTTTEAPVYNFTVIKAALV